MTERTDRNPPSGRGAIAPAPLVRFAGLRLAGLLLAGLLASAASPAFAQMSESDLVVRLNQLEGQMRRLTGDLEQLQYRNQQLEQQLRRMSEDSEQRFQELGRGSGRVAPSAAPPPAPGRRGEAPGASQAYIPPAGAAEPPAQQYSGGPAYAAADQTATAPAPAGRGRRGDAFDPTQSPGAPGTPRVLGQPGAPLDLSSMAAAAAADPSLGPGPAGAPAGLPPPPPRNPNATGAQMATLPPGGTPKDEYDLAYGYVLRKDYALAERTFRDFLRKYPSDRLAADAQYWLGESLFLRNSYKEAADVFLALTQRTGANPKGADAFLRLGQSLAALNQKEMACASFAQVGARYPRASVNVKQAVEREQKRVRCL